MPPSILLSLSSSPSSSTSASDQSEATMPKHGASTSSSTSSSFRSSEVLNYLWIPLLFSFSKEFAPTKAQDSILLPSEIDRSVPKLLNPKCPAPDPKLNYRPVIGILSHPGDGASGRLNNATNASYIAASYVKFVESAGARVIPLIYNEPREVLFNKLNLVNGVLFTGGWAKSGLYFEIVGEIFKKVLEKNDAGLYFPCYAICLGFELLTMIISKDNNILERFHAVDQASTLEFVKGASINGTLFQSFLDPDLLEASTDLGVYCPLIFLVCRFPPELRKKLSTDCLVMQNHQYGISPERFRGSALLSSFFNVLTTSADEEDKVYVSTVQAQKYPVSAFQWHPEKNAFEWGLSMIPHSEDAVQVTQHAANFLISEARKSSNRPPARAVLDNLIYNYSPTYCGKAGKGYDEVYIFT
ncbi:Gamma-glutamyl hydrolase 2, variant 2 [Ancistrocladus abbreviatus]